MTSQTHSFTYEPEDSEESYEVELDITCDWQGPDPSVGLFSAWPEDINWKVSIDGQAVPDRYDASLASDPSGGVVYNLSRWPGLNERAFAKEVQDEIDSWAENAEPPEPDYDNYRD